MINRNMRRGRSITLVVATCLVCLTRSIICDVIVVNSKTPGNNEDPKKQPNEAPVVAARTSSDVAKSNDENKNNNNDKTSSVPAFVETKKNFNKTHITANAKSSVETKTGNADTETASKFPEPSVIGHATSLNPGAVLRGFYVFVGLSVLALGYMVFRSFGVNKPRTQMVRKYGVLAHKQDIEMRPLPLDEDDEDDTIVFDASGLSPSRS